MYIEYFFSLKIVISVLSPNYDSVQPNESDNRDLFDGGWLILLIVLKLSKGLKSSLRSKCDSYISIGDGACAGSKVNYTRLVEEG